jgi:hypothetical protein
MHRQLSRIYRDMNRTHKKANKSSASKSNANLLKVSLPRNTYPRPGRVLSFQQAVGPVYTIDLNGVASLQTMSAGALAASASVGDVGAFVATFSSRWAACFGEYRLIGMRVFIRVNSVSSSTGNIAFYLDEKNSAVPTAATTSDARRIEVSAGVVSSNTVGQVAELTWMPHDLDDLEFLATTVGSVPVYLKCFASAALTGASGGAVVQINPVYRVQFRSLV